MIFIFSELEITDEQRRYQTETSINSSSGDNFEYNISSLRSLEMEGMNGLQQLEKNWKSFIPTRIKKVKEFLHTNIFNLLIILKRILKNIIFLKLKMNQGNFVFYLLFLVVLLLLLIMIKLILLKKLLKEFHGRRKLLHILINLKHGFLLIV